MKVIWQELTTLRPCNVKFDQADITMLLRWENMQRGPRDPDLRDANDAARKILTELLDCMRKGVVPT
jgi:hypothetical protein